MAAARFWRETNARYNLEGASCGNCDKVYFPARAICPDCHRESLGKMNPQKMNGTGEVVSFTAVHDGAKHLAMQSPYIMAIIQLDEGKDARLTAQLVECQEEELAIGTKVEAVFRRIQEDGKSGVIHYGYKFRPVKE
jgi:uncharacterized protein